ncbi:MAG: ROK family protein [Cryobacterium sp.]|nr:ROK family protein [Cryobacterium sp.]MBX3090456.1 ROK family protein [Cryobacterium sp.]MCO5293804.1 ROK family protein [Homoserinimonas sp.]
MTDAAIGIDIGGSGIKGAVVDCRKGDLLSDRERIDTPQGGEPEDILDTVVELFERFDGLEDDVAVGVCFPAIIRNGCTMSAANISKKWIGLEAEKLFEQRLKRDIHFVNDADAAGIGELRYGAASGRDGLTVLTTLGTGIGSALIYNGVLIPNSELGHLEIDGKEAEKLAAASVKDEKDLSWKEWAERLQRYYEHLELLLSPDLFLIGGGVSKDAGDFLPLLELQTEILPAMLKNNAGIIGAASLAAG